ncbi:hypothetical protein CMT41_03565 [Colwellia sp. MT41]|uniref:hypothetical protein n=1 Tax=Colwellia sp. MT41 TaxID=58049 RepID=UPI0007178302|nr:hypothetical protein [Colwellia sp. MT41]ALO33906.1 hypothetical protein CMT41_03565 [Colwellia sp. MT41]
MVEYEDDLNLGKLGESKLTEWCTAASLTSNQSLEEDKMGWDHLIEFPYEKTNLPRDMQVKPIECKIQVKSTLRRDKGVNIKLSALKRLVDYTSPAFILFYEFSNKKEPILDNSYLVHVDKQLITRVLKKIRQNDTSTKKKKLNEVKIKVTYSGKHKLNANSGLTLRDVITSFVPKGIAEYQKQKHELTESVGYEKDGLEFKFEASLQDFDQFLTESALGITDSFNINNTVLNDNRFNLKNGKVEIKRMDEAKISLMPSSVDKCKFRIKTSEYSPAVTFNANFITMPNIKTGNNSLYIKTKLFSYEMYEFNESIHNARLHYTLENNVELGEAIKFFKVFTPDNLVKKFIFELEFLEHERNLTFTGQIKHDFPDVALLVESIDVLIGSYEIDSNTITTLDKLYKDKDKLINLANVIQNKVGDFIFRLSQGSEHSNQQKVKIPLSMGVSIGSISIGVVALLHGEKIGDNEYQAYQAEVLEVLTFHNEKPTKELLKQLEEKAINRIKYNS